MANEHGKVMEELLFDLGAEASLEANLEEASSAYHLLSNKFAEIERVLGDDDARGAILVAATIVGDNIDRVDWDSLLCAGCGYGFYYYRLYIAQTAIDAIFIGCGDAGVAY